MISHASVVVTDARGRELMRDARLNEVDRYFADGADRAAEVSIPWNSTVDGKKIAGASSPFVIRVTVFDTEGRRSETRIEVER